MNYLGFSTSKGFRKRGSGIVEITETFSGIAIGENVVIGKMPDGATLDDIFGVRCETEHGEVQSIGGGTVSGNTKRFVCNGMTPVDNDLMILESADIIFSLDGNNIQFKINDWHGFTNKGVAYAHPEDGEPVFGDYEKVIKIYIM